MDMSCYGFFEFAQGIGQSTMLVYYDLWTTICTSILHYLFTVAIHSTLRIPSIKYIDIHFIEGILSIGLFGLNRVITRKNNKLQDVLLVICVQ